MNPRIPLALHIRKGTGETDLDFTQSHLTNFRLETGDSANVLRLPAEAGQTIVRIQVGKGSLEIHVPVGVVAHIHAATVQSTLEVDLTRFLLVEDGKEFRSSDYDTAANRVEIHLEMGLGSVTII